MFFYKTEEIDENDGNILFQVIGCVRFGIVQKLRGHYYCITTGNAWIDGSVGKYSQTFVQDVAAFLRVKLRKI